MNKAITGIFMFTGREGARKQDETDAVASSATLLLGVMLLIAEQEIRIPVLVMSSSFLCVFDPTSNKKI